MWCLSHCVCGSRLLQQQGPNIRGLREGRPNANFRSQSNDTFSWVIQKQCYASAEWPPRSSALLITAVQLSPFPTPPPTPPPPTLGTEMPPCVLGFPQAEDRPKAAMEKGLDPRKVPNLRHGRRHQTSRARALRRWMGFPRHPCQIGSCI